MKSKAYRYRIYPTRIEDESLRIFTAQGVACALDPIGELLGWRSKAIPWPPGSDRSEAIRIYYAPDTRMGHSRDWSLGPDKIALLMVVVLEDIPIVLATPTSMGLSADFHRDVIIPYLTKRLEVGI